MSDSVGVYVSVPFCRAKCTYCNFASGVFGAERMDAYVERVGAEIGAAQERVAGLGVELPGRVDTVYLGGGTPSLLGAEQMRRLFAALRDEFEVMEGAEITLECAPGQLSDETLEEMLRQGMNRVSFGVQSFVDAEARAVGRSHTREVCLQEIARMRAAGVGNINVDLIVGLPGQTAESWRESVEVAMESGVPHVSVYMLEVDEDSRLGREVLKAGSREQGTGNRGQGTGSREQGTGNRGQGTGSRGQGTGDRLRYGAGEVASEDEIAERYGEACEWLEVGGVRQYEISNFAREGMRSRHNMKYWRREPYVGFGLDAHSMLRSGVGGVRWANGDELEGYLESRGQGTVTPASQDRSPGTPTGNREQRASGELRVLQVRPELERIGREQAFEEAMFLGLRMNEGVDLEALRAEFGEGLMRDAVAALGDVEEAGLVLVEGERLRLTAKGRMASNEVFGRLLVGAV